MKTLTGSEALTEVLLDEQVKLITSYPGASILPIYHEILNNNMDLMIFKHEADAAFAADSFIRNSDKKSVVIASAGPGATNLITALANAKGDYVPIIAITVTVPLDSSGPEFQQVDIVNTAKPVVKKTFFVDE